MSEAVLRLSTAIDRFSSVVQDQTAVVLPSSLQNDDSVVSSLVDARNAAGGTTSICLPSWRGPFGQKFSGDRGRSMRTMQQVAQARFLVAVVNIDLIAGKGPFVLDLAARYLAPRARVRLLASPQRDLNVARVSQVVQFDVVVLSKQTKRGRVWLETADPIIAELVALALSEEDLLQDRIYPSPWEDPLVQQATEIELGVRFPGEIRLAVDRLATECDLSDIISTLHLRTGIDISLRSDHY